LILDDDGDVLDIMQVALTYEGFKVTCTDDANDILQLITNHKPDVLMVDYLLNGTTGGKVCHQVKENPETHNLPVILISAYPSKMILPTVCDDFIAKPFDLDDLVSRIRRWTDGRRNRDLRAVQHG